MFEPHVRALLAQVPDMPATVLAERMGWTGSIRWFSDNVKRLRPEHRPIDPSDRLTRMDLVGNSTAWAAGDAAEPSPHPSAVVLGAGPRNPSDDRISACGPADAMSDRDQWLSYCHCGRPTQQPGPHPSPE
jgi:hypothetical protein